VSDAVEREAVQRVALLVRRAVPGDEATLRAVRLRALTDAPGAYGSTLARELERTPDDWARWIDPDPAWFLCTVAGDLVGLAAGFHDREEEGAVVLAAVWVDPTVRGRGGVALLAEAFLAWAHEQAPRAVRLWVVDTNDVARRAYERLGFALTGHRVTRERDGVVELEMRRPVGPT
jgi:RimJ/RimL family protein N-acetyltransferase